jgi:signal transduction histidine kinase
VGIALENPDRIFQMFTRASEKSGTGGLGLYLIKQAVSRLGGDVGLQLTSEGFTEFYATLPLEIPKELTESSNEQESEAAKASA